MTERLLLIGAVGVLALGLAFSEFARLGGERSARARAVAIEAELAETRSDAKAALAAVIQPATIDQANQSVYLVLVNGNPNGTAFVVNRETGVLGTVAHVVASLPFTDKDARIEVLNQYSGVRLPVKTARVHAGYGSFTKAVEAYQPFRRNADLVSPKVVAVEETPFDVGVLIVNPLDPDTGENLLAPDLPIASEEKLKALKPGDPIAVIGFPSDRVGIGQIGDIADSRAERGVISALIAPVDNAAKPRDPEIANLIVHRMSTAGGNSGSPVLNGDGEVIGLHSHGISTPDSNGDSVAQRADVLIDILTPLREEVRLAALFRPAWQERLEYWIKARDLLPWSLYESAANGDAKEKRRVEDIDFDAKPPFELKMTDAKFSERMRRYVASAGDLARPSAIGQSENNAIGAVNQPAFVIGERGEYYEAVLPINPERENLIFAFDYAVGNGLGFCPLTTYWRTLGGDQLKVLRNRGATRLHLPAAETEAKGVQIVIKRASGCDRASRDFIFGAMDWPPEEEPSVNEAVADTHGAARIVLAAGDQVANSIDAAGLAVRTFVDCRVLGTGPRARCEEPEALAVSTVHADTISAPELLLSNDLASGDRP